MGSLEARLAEVVGSDHVLTDADLRASAEVDWTGRWRGLCRAVVRPGSPAELAAAVGLCTSSGVPVVPQGGNTGLVGGSVPVGLPDAVVLSTRRLTGLSAVDPAGTVVAGAGESLASVQRHARAAGWEFGLDYASRDSATVGGAVATNAGGLRVVRWGPARSQLVGVEAVLASGALVSRVDGSLKDSTGYDLSGLLCGSEGTLGVLTRVRLRLVPPLPAARAVALVGVPSVGAASALLGVVRRELPGLAAAELVGDSAMALVVGLGVPPPMPAAWPAYVLLENPGSVDELASVLAGASGVGDAVLAGDAAGWARLWRYREEVAVAISARGVPVKLDVSVPAGELARVWEALPLAVPAVAPEAQVVLFGHLAEANLHVNVLGASSTESAVEEAVLRLVASAGGSISAEHGIGRAKARWLGLTRPVAEVAAMRAIKDALDPRGLLNPGVLFP